MDFTLNNCDVMWIGFYKEKDVYENILKEIENNLENTNFYKTNLVKNVFNPSNKLTEKALKFCLDNLLKEIDKLNPKLIFILGSELADYLIKNVDYLEPTVIMINHPSYVYDSGKENIDLYISDVTAIIKNKLE